MIICAFEFMIYECLNGLAPTKPHNQSRNRRVQHASVYRIYTFRIKLTRFEIMSSFHICHKCIHFISFRFIVCIVLTLIDLNELSYLFFYFCLCVIAVART